MCGHRGAPKPPLSYTPATPKVVGAVQEFDSPLIWWERVSTFDDGRKIPQPQEVEYEVSVNFGKVKIKTRENYLKDYPLAEGEKRCYSVAAIYEGRKSQPSEPTCIRWKRPIYQIPKVVDVLEGDGFVKISFTPSPYLKTEVFKNQKEPFTSPYKVLDEGTSLFIDESVKNGESYTYLFRFSEGDLKGRFSKPVVAAPRDDVRPEPPQNALLVRVGESCTLVWEPSPSLDVVGYLIETERGRIETDGIYFTFKSCPGAIRLFAVDKAGNLSEEAKIEEVVNEESGSDNGE